MQRVVLHVGIQLVHRVDVNVAAVLFQKAHAFHRLLTRKAVVFEQRPRGDVGDRCSLIGDDQPVGQAEFLQPRKDGGKPPARAYGKDPSRRAVRGNGALVGFRDRSVRADERPVKVG